MYPTMMFSPVKHQYLIVSTSRLGIIKEIDMIWLGKVRPQIFLAIVVLGILSAVGLYYGMNEIATGCTGGIIALGMKVLESPDG